ncbi:hypothetical protein V495_01399 [Pseudogymnoascus sp. VKM F-4514 (FW-929)]|nr:hypothetical protein V495_01399 [Pseudogymnoascus sp. VKM F-4514 (FW-929)]KFY67273.1 hypothetical protein V497_00475 [Pseudogymnoascus sp. VKM F-4516 (FW-969)]
MLAVALKQRSKGGSHAAEECAPSIGSARANQDSRPLTKLRDRVSTDPPNGRPVQQQSNRPQQITFLQDTSHHRRRVFAAGLDVFEEYKASMGKPAIEVPAMDVPSDRCSIVNETDYDTYAYG